jgi:Ca-activated chloride channel homolog
MDAVLQVDHHVVDHLASPNVPPGVIVRALVTITGSAPANAARSPIGLTLVIDRSGSMHGDRIAAARTAAARCVERLHPDDVVSVVAFDDVVKTVAEPLPRSRHTHLKQKLLALDVNGSTNLSGGWLRGREHMQAARGLIGDLAGSSRRILVLTDGHANAGITEPSTLIELARTARAMGITTTTVGIGEGYDDALLRGMADAGGGNAWYIEDVDQSEDVLAEELGSLLSVSAQGLAVTLALSNAVRISVVHSDWPMVPTAGGMRFDLGDLYAAEPKPLLLELFVPQDKLAGLAQSPTAIATLTVSADVLTAQGGVEHRTIQLPLAASLDEQHRMEPEVERAVLLARAAKAREDAVRQQREGDVQAAEQSMLAAYSAIVGSPLMENEAYAAELHEQATDMMALAKQYRANTFSELEAKYQLQRSYNARRGKRSNDELIRRKPPES